MFNSKRNTDTVVDEAKNLATMKKTVVSAFVGLGLAVLGNLSFITTANSQASAEYLRPGQTKSFQAYRPSGQWNYSKWTSCFNSVSRHSKIARINVRASRSNSSYTYSTSSQKCISYRPTGNTWTITNRGNTNVAISIVPSYR